MRPEECQSNPHGEGTNNILTQIDFLAKKTLFEEDRFEPGNKV